MTDQDFPNPDDQTGEGTSPGRNEPQTQEIQYSQVSALVPERVARGTFSTGAVVLTGPHEFIIDFLLRMTRPHQVAARVVLPPQVVPRLIAALTENLENYKKRFGTPRMPEDQLVKQSGPQPPPQQTSAQELYEQLKLKDEDMAGVYANAVMIGHTATEFSFDFITTFFPRSVVSSRVFLSAPNVPRLLESLKHSFEQYQRKIAAARQNPHLPPPPESQNPPWL